MALMKAALAWERFVLKDVTRFAALAKVEQGVGTFLMNIS